MKKQVFNPYLPSYEYIPDGATAGYRWFDFRTAKEISVETRGTAEGEFVVRDGRDGPVAARIPVTPSEDWQFHTAPLEIEKGKRALYFAYEGTGAADFRSFSFA